MPLEQDPWLQLTDLDETSLWYGRFLLYRDMGPVRTMIGAVHLEQAARKIPREKWPKQPSGAWRDMAEKFTWKPRAEAWDEHRRKEVFTQGYAYDLNRIKTLDEVTVKLVERVKLSLDTMKPRRGGFPDFEIGRMLEAMEALAKETGGRIQKKEVTGANGAPLEVLLYMPEQEPEDLLEDPDLEDIVEGEDEWEESK